MQTYHHWFFIHHEKAENNAVFRPTFRLYQSAQPRLSEGFSTQITRYLENGNTNDVYPDSTSYIGVHKELESGL